MPTGVRARHRAELDPADVEPLEQLHRSVAELATRRSELVLTIHQHLLVTFTGAAWLPSAGRPVARRLTTALLQAAAVDDPSASVSEVVRGVGVENLADGLDPEWGDIVSAMLLTAVRSLYGQEWTDQLNSGWTAYVLWLRDQWADGAARAH
jgi:hemoglobin-like flavoprotein